MDENRMKLCFVLVVLAIFFAVFGEKLTKVLDWLGSLGEFKVPKGDRSPYLYKGSGLEQKGRVETGSNEDELEGTIWGQQPCSACGGIPNGRFVGAHRGHARRPSQSPGENPMARNQ